MPPPRWEVVVPARATGRVHDELAKLWRRKPSGQKTVHVDLVNAALAAACGSLCTLEASTWAALCAWARTLRRRHAGVRGAAASHQRAAQLQQQTAAERHHDNACAAVQLVLTRYIRVVTARLRVEAAEAAAEAAAAAASEVPAAAAAAAEASQQKAGKRAKKGKRRGVGGGVGGVGGGSGTGTVPVCTVGAEEPWWLEVGALRTDATVAEHLLWCAEELESMSVGDGSSTVSALLRGEGKELLEVGLRGCSPFLCLDTLVSLWCRVAAWEDACAALGAAGAPAEVEAAAAAAGEGCTTGFAEHVLGVLQQRGLPAAARTLILGEAAHTRSLLRCVDLPLQALLAEGRRCTTWGAVLERLPEQYGLTPEVVATAGEVVVGGGVYVSAAEYEEEHAGADEDGFVAVAVRRDGGNGAGAIDEKKKKTLGDGATLPAAMSVDDVRRLLVFLNSCFAAHARHLGWGRGGAVRECLQGGVSAGRADTVAAAAAAAAAREAEFAALDEGAAAAAAAAPPPPVLSEYEEEMERVVAECMDAVSALSLGYSLRNLVAVAAASAYARMVDAPALLAAAARVPPKRVVGGYGGGAGANGIGGDAAAVVTAAGRLGVAFSAVSPARHQLLHTSQCVREARVRREAAAAAAAAAAAYSTDGVVGATTASSSALAVLTKKQEEEEAEAEARRLGCVCRKARSNLEHLSRLLEIWADEGGREAENVKVSVFGQEQREQRAAATSPGSSDAAAAAGAASSCGRRLGGELREVLFGAVVDPDAAVTVRSLLATQNALPFAPTTSGTTPFTPHAARYPGGAAAFGGRTKRLLLMQAVSPGTAAAAALQHAVRVYGPAMVCARAAGGGGGGGGGGVNEGEGGGVVAAELLFDPSEVRLDAASAALARIAGLRGARGLAATQAEAEACVRALHTLAQTARHVPSRGLFCVVKKLLRTSLEQRGVALPAMLAPAPDDAPSAAAAVPAAGAEEQGAGGLSASVLSPVQSPVLDASAASGDAILAHVAARTLLYVCRRTRAGGGGGGTRRLLSLLVSSVPGLTDAPDVKVHLRACCGLPGDEAAEEEAECEGEEEGGGATRGLAYFDLLILWAELHAFIETAVRAAAPARTEAATARALAAAFCGPDGAAAVSLGARVWREGGGGVGGYSAFGRGSVAHRLYGGEAGRCLGTVMCLSGEAAATRSAAAAAAGRGGSYEDSSAGRVPFAFLADVVYRQSDGGGGGGTSASSSSTATPACFSADDRSVEGLLLSLAQQRAAAGAAPGGDDCEALVLCGALRGVHGPRTRAYARHLCAEWAASRGDDGDPDGDGWAAHVLHIRRLAASWCRGAAAASATGGGGGGGGGGGSAATTTTTASADAAELFEAGRPWRVRAACAFEVDPHAGGWAAVAAAAGLDDEETSAGRRDAAGANPATHPAAVAAFVAAAYAAAVRRGYAERRLALSLGERIVRSGVDGLEDGEWRTTAGAASLEAATQRGGASSSSSGGRRADQGKQALRVPPPEQNVLAVAANCTFFRSAEGLVHAFFLCSAFSHPTPSPLPSAPPRAAAAAAGGEPPPPPELTAPSRGLCIFFEQNSAVPPGFLGELIEDEAAAAAAAAAADGGGSSGRCGDEYSAAWQQTVLREYLACARSLRGAADRGAALQRACEACYMGGAAVGPFEERFQLLDERGYDVFVGAPRWRGVAAGGRAAFAAAVQEAVQLRRPVQRRRGCGSEEPREGRAASEGEGEEEEEEEEEEDDDCAMDVEVDAEGLSLLLRTLTLHTHTVWLHTTGVDAEALFAPREEEAESDAESDGGSAACGRGVFAVLPEDGHVEHTVALFRKTVLALRSMARAWRAGGGGGGGGWTTSESGAAVSAAEEGRVLAWCRGGGGGGGAAHAATFNEYVQVSVWRGLMDLLFACVSPSGRADDGALSAERVARLAGSAVRAEVVLEAFGEAAEEEGAGGGGGGGLSQQLRQGAAVASFPFPMLGHPSSAVLTRAGFARLLAETTF